MGWGTRGKGGGKGFLGDGDGTRYVDPIDYAVCLKDLSRYIAHLLLVGGVNCKMKNTTGEVRTELSYDMPLCTSKYQNLLTVFALSRRARYGSRY